MALKPWVRSARARFPSSPRAPVVLGLGDDMNDINSSPISSSFSPELLRLGFAPWTEQALAEAGVEDPAHAFRVTRVMAHGCVVSGCSGSAQARVPKKLWSRRPPVVGDWVVARTSRGELHVRRILPRITTLERRAAGSEHRGQTLAANVDVVLVCMGLDQNFRVARMERWLTVAHQGGAKPVVVLTKAGTVDDSRRSAAVEACRAAALNVDVVAVDVLAGLGIPALEAAIRPNPGSVHTVALLGSSGVGKSTLVNFLSGGDRLPTRATSTATGKGRHTTSHRELFEIPERGLVVIDTPGLREVGLWGDAEGIERTFADLVEAARACRFRDCMHTSEPGCAIRAGVEAGTLDARRVRSWLGLAEEQERTSGKVAEHERRAKARKFSKLIRATLQSKASR